MDVKNDEKIHTITMDSQLLGYGYTWLAGNRVGIIARHLDFFLVQNGAAVSVGTSMYW